jgi:hypothetical protein
MESDLNVGGLRRGKTKPTLSLMQKSHDKQEDAGCDDNFYQTYYSKETINYFA